ncbi:hypothetical protein RDI58_011255 [Solanum bulbocastanum]|uniref:Uncharacterized protein n=1 Tax=Solanum bulbocastanum TaxID=147425 RepID=A0AAN8YG36_SOLBU
MKDAIEVIPTTHHSHVSIEETVLNKKADEHGVDTLQQNLEKASFKYSSC